MHGECKRFSSQICSAMCSIRVCFASLRMRRREEAKRNRIDWIGSGATTKPNVSTHTQYIIAGMVHISGNRFTSFCLHFTIFRSDITLSRDSNHCIFWIFSAMWNFLVLFILLLFFGRSAILCAVSALSKAQYIHLKSIFFCYLLAICSVPDFLHHGDSGHFFLLV